MLQIRPYSPQDREVVFQLADKYTSFDVERLLPADMERLEAKNTYFFVAEDESGAVVAFIAGYERKGVPERVLNRWKAKRVGYVDLMAVDEKERRKGAGTALLNMLLDRFQMNGIDLVDLDVPVEQNAAAKLYEKFGFKMRAFSMRKKLV